MTAAPRRKTEMLNFISPGSSQMVDAEKFEAVRDALLSALPSASPGLTTAEIKRAMLPDLPQHLFPGGDKAGWWIKGVQLDLEARGLVLREKTTPLRFRKA